MRENSRRKEKKQAAAERSGGAAGGGDQGGGAWPADVVLLLAGCGRWQSEDELDEQQRDQVGVLLLRGWIERRKFEGGEVWFGEQVVADQAMRVPGGWHFRTTAAGEEYLRKWQQAYERERDALLGESGGQATARQIVGQIVPAGGHAERQQGEGVGEKSEAAKLTAAVRLAWLSFVYAEQQNERRMADREAWDWLREHGCEGGVEDAGELTDYELPSFDTWCRNLRRARRLLGEQKNVSRQGRRGRSIVERDQLE